MVSALSSGLTEGTEQRRQGCGESHGRDHLTAGGHVVHKSTRLSVRSVDRTQEAPGLGQKLPDRGGPHLGEGGPSVHAAEVRQVADEVQLVCDDRKSGALQHPETCRKRDFY